MQTKTMPEAFDKCVSEGGSVRTIDVKDHPGMYMHICYKGGKAYPGERKMKKGREENKAGK